MDIKELLKDLPEEELEKYPKFSSTISCALENKDADKIVELLEENGLKFKEMKDIRVLNESYDDVRLKLQLLNENNQMELVTASLEILRRNIKEIIERIKLCIKVGKGYKDSEGKVLNFILNGSLWNEVKKGLAVEEKEETVEETTEINPDAVTYEDLFGDNANIIRDAKEATSDYQITISNESIEREFRVHDMIVEILKNMYGISDLEDDMDNDLKCLISTSLTDKEIAEAVILLSYLECGSSKETVEPVKEYLKQVINELNFDESYGVAR